MGFYRIEIIFLGVNPGNFNIRVANALKRGRERDCLSFIFEFSKLSVT